MFDRVPRGVSVADMAHPGRRGWHADGGALVVGSGHSKRVVWRYRECIGVPSCLFLRVFVRGVVHRVHECTCICQWILLPTQLKYTKRIRLFLVVAPIGVYAHALAHSAQSTRLLLGLALLLFIDWISNAIALLLIVHMSRWSSNDGLTCY